MITYTADDASQVKDFDEESCELLVLLACSKLKPSDQRPDTKTSLNILRLEVCFERSPQKIGFRAKGGNASFGSLACSVEASLEVVRYLAVVAVASLDVQDAQSE